MESPGLQARPFIKVGFGSRPSLNQTLSSSPGQAAPQRQQKRRTDTLAHSEVGCLFQPFSQYRVGSVKVQGQGTCCFDCPRRHNDRLTKQEQKQQQQKDVGPAGRLGAQRQSRLKSHSTGLWPIPFIRVGGGSELVVRLLALEYSDWWMLDVGKSAGGPRVSSAS